MNTSNTPRPAAPPRSGSLTHEVAVVGAGPVGLTLALGLARRGVRTLVVEAKRAIAPQSRAVALFPRSLEALDAVGVLDGIARRGQVNRHLRMRRASDARTLLDFDFNALDRVTAANFAVAIPQDRTETVLLEALRAEPCADVRFATALVGFEELGGEDDRGGESDGRVRLELRDVLDGEGPSDASGPVSKANASWLVGTDGARSRVRERLGLKLEGHTYDSRAYLADVRVTEEADFVDGWPVLTNGESFVNGVRYAERTWRLIDQGVPERVHEGNYADHARAIGERLFGPGSIEEVIWASAYRKHERQASTFRRGRVLIAGDAAHLNSPAGGQGMNTGLRDAHNLAWKLHLVVAGGATVDADRLLDSYSREQRDAFAREVAPLTDAVERAQTAPGWVRRLAFRSLWLVGALGQDERLAKSLSMLFLELEDSTILGDTDERVGRRMPNVALPGGRLYEHVGPWGLILDRDGDEVTRALAARFGLAFARLPRSLDELGFEGVETLYVRPDHVIGRVSPEALDEDDLRAALALRSGARLPATDEVGAATTSVRLAS